MNRNWVRAVAVATSAVLTVGVGATAAQAADPTITFNARTAGNAVLNAIDGTIAVTTSVPGKVEYKAAGVVIKGCEAVATTPTATANGAVCTWKATKAGATELTATLTPTDTALAVVTTKPLTAYVGVPINEGDEYQPVSIYADTVNGSGYDPKIAPYLNNASCLLMSQFVQGMGIVFRVYANDHTRGGIPLTSANAKVSVTIAGIAQPLELTWGNHSGAAFWAGQITTGPVGSGKQYTALGEVKYTINVTTLKAPAVTKKVMVTEYQPIKKNGKTVKVNGVTAYKMVKVSKTVVVTPEVVDKVYSFSPDNWPSTSLLRVIAAPAA